MTLLNILGFENGEFVGNTPTTADMVVGSSYRRAGPGGLGSQYGCRVNAQSGVSTSLTLAGNSGVTNSLHSLFYRSYIQLKSLPSSTRSILKFATSLGAVTGILLRLTSAGALDVYNIGGAVSLGTSYNLSLDTWYRVELGLSYNTGHVSLRINGEIIIDWTSSTGVGSTSSFFIGAPDTVSTALDYWIDDVVVDRSSWPGSGRVIALKPTSVVNDHVNWVLSAGASKVAAVSETPSDGDTSYLTSPGATGQRIDFSFSAVPPDVITPQGALFWVRMRRDAAGAATPEVRGRIGAKSSTTTLGGMTSAGSTSYSWFSMGLNDQGPGEHLATNVMASRISVEDLANLGIRLGIISGTNKYRVSNILVEVAYDDRSNSTWERGIIEQFHGLDSSPTNELSVKTNGGLQGTGAAYSTTRQRFSPLQSLRCSPSGTTAFLRFGSDTALLTQAILAFWLYVDSFPASGYISLCGTSNCLVRLSSTGELYVTTSINGDSSKSAAGTITTGRWYFVVVSFRRETVPGTSADGRTKIWVDDNLKVDATSRSYANEASTAGYLQLGIINSATADISIANATVDTGYYLPKASTRYAALFPVAAGSVNSGSIAASAGSKYDCIDDPVGSADGDTSYVRSTTANVVETYSLTLPSDLVRILSVFVHSTVRVESSSGSASLALIFGSFIPSSLPSLATISTVYTFARTTYFAPPIIGEWRNSLFSTLELMLNLIAVPASGLRVSRAAAVLEYTISSSEPAAFNPMAQILG